jgi:hypothetical protein
MIKHSFVKGNKKRKTLGLLRSFQQGDVAQLVRACGSYPQRPGFKSLHRHHLEKNQAPLLHRGAYLFKKNVLSEHHAALKVTLKMLIYKYKLRFFASNLPCLVSAQNVF